MGYPLHGTGRWRPAFSFAGQALKPCSALEAGQSASAEIYSLFQINLDPKRPCGQIFQGSELRQEGRRGGFGVIIPVELEAPVPDCSVALCDGASRPAASLGRRRAASASSAKGDTETGERSPDCAQRRGARPFPLRPCPARLGKASGCRTLAPAFGPEAKEMHHVQY